MSNLLFDFLDLMVLHRAIDSILHSLLIFHSCSAMLENPLSNPHRLEDVLALDENLIDALQRKTLGLREEEVHARRNQAQVHDGPDDIELVADCAEAGRCDFDGHEVECP